MWLVDTETVAAQSEAILDGCFTSNYQNYRIVWNGSGSTTSELRLHLRNAGLNKTATEYVFTGLDRNNVVLNTFGQNAKQNYMYVTNNSASDNLSFSTIDIFRPQETFRTGMLWNSGFEWVSNELYYRSGLGYYDVTDSCDGFRVFASSGTISGSVRVYGYRN
jgi:hypothetical protein